MEQGLSVGEVAEKVGLSVHTLRWYEQVGLLDPVPRDSAGHRRYRERDVDRLDLLTKMRATGMPVKEMVRYIELVRAGDDSRLERLSLLEQHRVEVIKRIEELQSDLTVIDRKIANYRRLASSASPNLG